MADNVQGLRTGRPHVFTASLPFNLSPLRLAPAKVAPVGSEAPCYRTF